MSRSYPNRRGFTLVEMLVVISIIGILMSLLVPAAMRAREQGRIVQCGNNLRQLGVALQSYESTFKVYPLNWGWTSDTGDSSTVGHSWIALILPQLDMMPTYQRIKMSETLKYRQMSGTTVMFDNSLVARLVLPILKCPSDLTDGSAMTLTADPTMGQRLTPVMDTGGDAADVGVTSYKANCGTNYPYFQNWQGTATAPAGGVYRGRNRSKPAKAQAGTDYRDYCNGIICRGYNPTCSTGKTTSVNRSVETYFPTSSADIFDGASYTIAIGEAVPGVSQWSAWYWWNGSLANSGIFSSASDWTNKQGTVYSSPVNFAVNLVRVGGTVSQGNSYGFNSRHSGMAQFVMCDGAVHQITEGIALTVFNQLAAIDDREMIDNKALGW